jgi:hypothetical protein
VRRCCAHYGADQACLHFLPGHRKVGRAGTQLTAEQQCHCNSAKLWMPQPVAITRITFTLTGLLGRPCQPEAGSTLYHGPDCYMVCLQQKKSLRCWNGSRNLLLGLS